MTIEQLLTALAPYSSDTEIDIALDKGTIHVSHCTDFTVSSDTLDETDTIVLLRPNRADLR